MFYMLSGVKLIKSQDIFGSLKLFFGFLFLLCTTSGNLIGSLMKKNGVLLQTKSRIPSSVYILIANPLGSLSVSENPASPKVVEKRTATGVRFPTLSNNLALQYFVISWVTSKYPNAPAPLA